MVKQCQVPNISIKTQGIQKQHPPLRSQPYSVFCSVTRLSFHFLIIKSLYIISFPTDGEGENLLDDILDDYHEGDDFTVEMNEETGGIKIILNYLINDCLTFYYFKTQNKTSK